MDGIDHINIYSKGKTELGHYLSNFTEAPFKHPYEKDKFNSVEGYWYYDITGNIDLRLESGFKAKQLGRDTIKSKLEEGFEEWDVYKPNIKLAIICKLTQNRPDLLEDFINSTLPFRHYYTYGDKIIEPKEGKWIVQFFEDLRRILK